MHLAIAVGLGRDQVSQRRACRLLGQSRSTQRRVQQVPADEPPLVKRIVPLASDYGRYGYRRVTALLWGEGSRGPRRLELFDSKGSPRTGSRTPRPSSSSSGSTTARASSNTR